MTIATTTLGWAVTILLFTVPLALGLLLALPTGALVQIAVHAGLLVGGAATVLALRPHGERPPR